jgi:DUF4097 and DUF4098 domain-containing protein YvlB
MEKSKTPISDEQLRLMLNQLLLDEQDGDATNNDLMNMESAIVMQQEPLLTVDALKEKEFIKRLERSFSGFGGWHYLFSALAIGVLGFLFYFILHKDAHSSGLQRMNQSVSEERIQSIPAEPNTNEHSDKPKRLFIPGLILDSASKRSSNSKTDTLNVYQTNDMLPAFDGSVPLSLQNDWGKELETPGKQHTFPIDTFFQGVKRLEVEGIYFPVKVNVHELGDILLKGELSVEGTSKQTRQIKYEVEYVRKGDVLKVKVIQTGRKGWIMTGSINIKGFLQFNIPAETDLVIDNSSGDIYANGLKGNICTLNSNYGNIIAENISAMLKVSSSSGDIRVSKITGNPVLHSSYGNVTVSDLSGNLKLTSSSGNVDLDKINGEMVIESRYGNVSANNIEGATTITASSGNVEVMDMIGKWCNIKSDYGRIRMSRIQAPMILKARSGDLILKKLTGNLKVESSYGSTSIEEVKGDLDITAVSGEVSISGSSGYCYVSSTYGDVMVNDCKTNPVIKVQSGSIRIRNTMIDDSLTVSSGYGDIQLQLLNDINDLSYDLTTDYGTIHTPLNSDEPPVSKDKLYLRRGNKWIRANTHSGNITIKGF